MTLFRSIRAVFDDRTITVYQAFNPEIAEAAVAAGRFVAPFSVTRMTWVKPSFLWMMERCGWATKPGQERVLAVKLLRERFDWALSVSAPTHFDPALDASAAAYAERAAKAPVRVQWDPERNVRGQKLNHRSLQVGLGAAVAPAYAREWCAGIEDVTPRVLRLRSLRTEGRWGEVEELLPEERLYPVADAVAKHIGATVEGA